MKNIVICNQKGGVGKTLISDELAFMFEKDEIKINFYDLDQQGGTLHQTQESEDAAVSIIDTPGALMSELPEWIKAADMIIIPTLMSNRDAAPLERMLQIVKKNKRAKTPVLVIMNRWDRCNITKDFAEWFVTRFPDSKSAVLCSSTDFNQASARGISVQAYRRNGKAAAQMAQIYGYIKTTLNIKEGWR